MSDESATLDGGPSASSPCEGRMRCNPLRPPKGHVSRISTDFDRWDPAKVTEVLMELATVTGCPARIGALHPDGVVYWEATSGATTAARRSVASVPAHRAACGLVMLAFSDAAAADEMITRELRRFGSAGGNTRAEVEQALSVIRLSGVAVTQIQRPGRTFSVAVPVRDADGAVVAGLELDVDGFDLVETILNDLQAASRRLSHDATDQ
jgi:DNA-binding IclR family transcriptional regulator